MVQKGPDGPKRGPKWSKTLRLTILVSCGPFWTTLVIIYSAIDQEYIKLSLASCNKDEIWDLRAELGLTWDHFRALVPIGTMSQIWDIITSTVLVILIFSFPRPNFPKLKPKPSKIWQKFRNREVSKPKCQSLVAGIYENVCYHPTMVFLMDFEDAPFQARSLLTKLAIQKMVANFNIRCYFTKGTEVSEVFHTTFSWYNLLTVLTAVTICRQL